MIWPPPPDEFSGPEREAFERTAHHITGRRFLQLGAYTGACTIWLAEKFPDAEIHDVDTWSGPIDSEQCDSPRGWSLTRTIYDERTTGISNLMVHQTTTDEFFETSLEFFDFIYVDADHSTAAVLRDAINSFEHLRVGGIIAFDDYHVDPGEGDVPRLAIDQFLSDYADRIEVLPEPTGIGVVEHGYQRQVWIRKVAS